MENICESCKCDPKDGVWPYEEDYSDALGSLDFGGDDVVNKPSHYARWSIEPITYIMRNGMEFWRGNIIKYSSRAGFKIYDGKTQEESEILDLEKVKRYCDMRINQITGEQVL